MAPQLQVGVYTLLPIASYSYIPHKPLVDQVNWTNLANKKIAFKFVSWSCPVVSQYIPYILSPYSIPAGGPPRNFRWLMTIAFYTHSTPCDQRLLQLWPEIPVISTYKPIYRMFLIPLK